MFVWLIVLSTGCGAIVAPSAIAKGPDVTPTIFENPCGAGSVTEFTEYTAHSIENFGEAKDTKYVLVLLDRLDGSSEEIEKTISFMQNDIVSELSVGDRLVMVWIEPDNTTPNSLILDKTVDSVEVSLNDFPEKPTLPIVQPTPVIEGSTAQKGLQQMAAATVESENAFATEQYHCAIGKWNAESKDIYDNWLQEKQNNLNVISEDIRAKLTDSTINTTSPNRDIYGALGVALEIAQPHLKQNNFSQYTLLLLSSMEDIGNTPPLSMDLQVFDTLIVVAEECASNHPCDTRNEWQSKLQILGITPTFLSLEESSENIEDGHVECTLTHVETIDIKAQFALDSTEYVMILVDKSEDYQPYLADTINLITSTIVTELISGDYLLAAWIDLDPETDTSIPISTRIPSIDIPPITELPSGPSSTLCDRQEWNLTVLERYNKWKRDQQIVVENAAHTISDEMSRPELLNGKSIYAALSLVSDVSASSRNGDEFKRVTLFIFSDMELDNIHENPKTSWVQAMNIDFKNTNVYFVFFSCRFESDCERDPQKTRWTSEMIDDFGVEPGHVRFLTMEDNSIDSFLSDYMKEYDSE